jgi:hypothetical protein
MSDVGQRERPVQDRVVLLFLRGMVGGFSVNQLPLARIRTS